MPRSAIDARLADVIAPVEELPGRILAYLAHAPHLARPEGPIDEQAPGALEKIYVLLRAHTGNDFSLYKKSTIYRRIERRMGLHQIDGIQSYVRFLRENPSEVDALFKELLIGVTSFFRDPAAWEQLRSAVLPELLASRAGSGLIRAWVPGCSTGEEAYSLAIVLKEAMAPLQSVRNFALQVFATDIDKDAIEQARLGLYPESIVADVSPDRLRRFFVPDERGYRIGKEIRESVVFAPQNLAMDPPFTKLDLLSCRNLLIYLSAELQKKLIPLFHYALNPGGVLFLGSAETIGGFTAMFSALEGSSRIYRRLEPTVATAPVEFPSGFVTRPLPLASELEAGAAPPSSTIPPNLQALADHVLVKEYAPTGIFCNDKGDVLYTSGRTGKYLEPAIGRASLNVFAMAREGLRFELSNAFSAAQRHERKVVKRGLTVGTNGGTQVLDLTVQRLTEPRELRGAILIVLADAEPAPAVSPAVRPRPKREATRVATVEQALKQAREELQTVREEMQTSQEELKSTNEELQSTNEELQSTNEELTTSKEEMQSLNEELQTVNYELQAKVDELSRSNNDMKNLLNSTDIATLFLDGELKIRRFTTQTTKIIKLIPGDAGRLVTDISSDLDYSDLADDAREVIRTLVFRERQVGTRDGRWFVVRIMPYRTLENVIDGVVITFTETTTARSLELALREQAGELRQMADALPNLVWGARPDGVCDFVSRRWVQYTGIEASEQLGHRWLEQVHPGDREGVREEWRDAVRSEEPLDGELRLRSASGAYRWFKTRLIPIRSTQGEITKWYGTCIDIDELKQSETARGHGGEQLVDILEGLSEGFVSLDGALSITFINTAAERLLGRSRRDVTGQALLQAFPQLDAHGLAEKLTNLVGRADGAAERFELRVPGREGGRSFLVRVHSQRHRRGVVLLIDPGPSSPGDLGEDEATGS